MVRQYCILRAIRHYKFVGGTGFIVPGGTLISSSPEYRSVVGLSRRKGSIQAGPSHARELRINVHLVARRGVNSAGKVMVPSTQYPLNWAG